MQKHFLLYENGRLEQHNGHRCLTVSKLNLREQKNVENIFSSHMTFRNDLNFLSKDMVTERLVIQVTFSKFR